jgi:DNA-binding NarL/FixJ family response regulator
MRVVIAEDQVLLREGLARLFEDGGHEIVASLPDAEHLPAAVAGHRPDLVVLDVRMPPTFTDEGARAAKQIKEQHPELGVLVLSQHVETAHAVELVSQGGFGYLLKNRVLDVAAFLAAAERVAAGGSALDPQVVASLVSPGSAADDPLAALSAREREVLELMAEGFSNQGIAERLAITVRSTEKYVSSIFSKLDLPDTPSEQRRVLAVLRYLRV